MVKGIQQKKSTDLHFNEDLSAVIGMPAHVVHAKNPQPSVDTISKCDSSVQSLSSIRSRPHLSPPQEFDSTKIDEARSGLKKLVTLNQEDTPLSRLEPAELLLTVLNDMYELGTLRAKVMRDRIIQKQNEWQQVEDQRHDKIKEKVNASKRLSIASLVQETLVSAALMTSGTVMIATGATAAAVATGAAAIFLSVIAVVDKYCEDATKRKIASFIARGNEEQKEIWQNRLKTFFGVANFCLAMGLSGKTAVEVGMKVAQGTVAGTKGLLEWRQNLKQAVIMELDAACQEEQTNYDMLMQELERIINLVRRFEQNIHLVETKLEQIFSKINAPK